MKNLKSHSHRQGSALAFVMILIAVLSTIAAGLLFSASARYHTTYQSASWQESLVAAEAGVDLAMNELRKRVINGSGGAFDAASNWTSKDSDKKVYADNGHAFPINNQPYLITTHGGEGNSQMSVRVFVDVPGSGTNPWPLNSLAQQPSTNLDAFMCEQSDAQGNDPQSHWWYRIRALGIAGVSGPPRVNLDTRDNRLRKFSFFTDWRTGTAVNTPQVSRLVEVIAKPLTSFRNAMMAQTRIDLGHQDVLIDSYNSGKGYYNPLTNTGFMGNIATNGQLINANGATVLGDAMTNDGSVKDAQGVTGAQRADFFEELTPVKALTGWGNVPAQFIVTDNATYTASKNSDQPTRVHLNGINLPLGGKKILITPPADAKPGEPSYIKILVEGDINTIADSFIEIADGVNAIFYVTGNINLQGHGIFNDSYTAGRVLINGVQPPVNKDGTYPKRSITIATDQDFEGIIYAPNHDLTLALNVVKPNGDPPSPTDATALLIQQLTNKAADYDHQAADKQQESNNEMAEWKKTKDINHYNNAVNALTQMQVAQAAAVVVRQQINSLLTQPPPPENPGAADDRLQGYNGVYGAFVGRTINVLSKTHLHYDEALREAGPVNHYQAVNWFEDTASRGTVSW